MSNVGEIASMAGLISARQQAQTMQEVSISTLKQSMAVEADLQKEMINMLSQLNPNLGANVDISA